MNKITNEQLDSLIKSAVNSSGPLPPDEKFSQIISALRELRELRASLLQGKAEPVSNRDELPGLIEGMEVSVDVSTCDTDAGHRYFGTVTEVSELDGAKNGYILLVQDAEPNFKHTGNSPVIPDGWKLVPIIAFPSQWAAGQKALELAGINKVDAVYKAMLAAAPQEVKGE